MRLIDADKIQFKCTYHGDCRNKECKRCPAYMCSYSEIDEQPTAYDKDEVIENIKRYAMSEICDQHKSCPYINNQDVTCENCGALGTLDIVKRGGVK